MARLQEATAGGAAAVLVVLFGDLAQACGIDNGILPAPRRGRRQLSCLRSTPKPASGPKQPDVVILASVQCGLF